MKNNIYLKRMLKISSLYVAVIIFSILSSCVKDRVPIDNTEIKTMTELNVDPGFDFNTIRDVNIQVSVKDNQGNGLQFIRIDIYDGDSETDPEVNASRLPTGNLIYSGSTDVSGNVTVKIPVATRINELYISTRYLGLPTKTKVSILNNNLTCTLGGNLKHTKSSVHYKNVSNVNYNTLGTWDNSGVPDYLEDPGDAIDASLLATLNASLPEYMNQPVYHPEYFNPGLESGITLSEESDVWITFVHENAGWMNSLGFYYYNVNNPPATVNDITNKTIIFPNTSYAGSGGGMISGDKVHLGVFPAGTVIHWFLVAQGWNSSSHTVGNGVYTHYSESQFNSEADPNLRKHYIALYDDVRDILMVGYEDIKRDLSNCDNDFNDVVFYAKAVPVDNGNYPPPDDPVDTDNDGVTDPFDDYPLDPGKAYDNWFPSESTYSTLGFEDLWPSQGDYDFNDIVLAYQFNEITNATNNVVEIQANYKLMAMGASFRNGFGIELPISYTNIASVTGGNYNSGYINLNANGTEANQTNAVIIAFDNGYNILSYPGEGIGVNTTTGAPYVNPGEVHQTIVLSTPVQLNALGTAPFNPFIIIDQNRDLEVHLPDMPPTDLADPSVFGTHADSSEPGNDRWYKTSANLPWAINIAAEFDYPIEKADINSAYLFFGTWAESMGLLFPDWYENEIGYRNDEKIYSH